MKIFDFHLHPGYDFHENDTDPDRFISILKENGLCGCAGCFSNLAMYKKPVEEFEHLLPQLNEKAWEWKKAYPDFFVPGIHIHPDFPSLSCEEMEKHKNRGGVLLGEVVYYMMGFQYVHPSLPEIFHYAKELGLVVNLHPCKKMAYNKAIIDAVPGLTVVLAHLDGYGLYEDFISLMQENENVYADLSAYGADRKGMLSDAVNRVGSHRFLYGTDFPGANDTSMQKRYIQYVLSEDLTDDARENIFYRNAAHLLHLEK